MPKNIKINLADCLGTSNKCGKVDEQRIWEFQRRLETLEAKPDNDNQLLSLTDNKLSITNGNEVVLPVYDDTKLSEKVKELENRPHGSNQTLTLSGDTLSISNGNSVKVPQMVQWYPHIAWAEEINPVKNFTTRTSVSAPQSAGFYANYVGFCYTTDKEDPQEPSKYRWTRVSQVTELEKQLEELKKNGLASTPQTLSIEGNTLTISEGNSVELPTSTNKELEKVVENLKPLSNNISGEMRTYSGHSLYINKIGDFVHLTFDSYAVRNIYELPEGFRPKFTQTAPLWHKETGEYVGKVVLEPNGNFDATLVDKFKPLSYPLDKDPHDGTNIFENIHTLTMSYYVGG